MPSRSTLTHAPTVYACRKLDEMLGRWNSELGSYVRRYGPAVWPGTPAPALIGMGANSTGATECVTSAGFYEIGYYNTPGGTVSPGDTSCTQAGRSGRWYSFGQSQEFQRLVGRRAPTTGWSSDVEAQAVIGLMDYKASSRSVASLISPSLRPTSGSQWEFMLGCMGYVNGAAGVARLANAHPELASVNQTLRFGALARIAADTAAPSSVCYPMVRAWERLACGRLLAASVGQSTSWYDVGLGADQRNIEHILTRRWIGSDDGAPPSAYYESCRGISTREQDGWFGSADPVPILLAASVAYLAYSYMPRRSRR